ncbi:MAG: CDP-alcohol phosphatidyltransferase family protein [Chitinophagaceae bacterium]|nr:CDP-alcohol phosphatidyltransferase family protein [Chitinophagaceae bacterium]
MSKLAAQDTFLDLADYGRPAAKLIAQRFKNTKVTSIHLTLLFGVSGLVAIFCMLKGYNLLASFFIILKSILDAADGELSRIKNTPSYVGRYLDSVFDIILNFMFLISIAYVSKATIGYTLLAFISIQLQGTLYNYYYVILRNKSLGADSTSKIFENKAPRAFAGEKQSLVNIWFRIFHTLYVVFDKSIYYLDKGAYKVKTLPNWFMTFVSIYGLGFQLLIIAIMLPLNLKEFIIPFFIGYNVFMIVIIFIRKNLSAQQTISNGNN